MTDRETGADSDRLVVISADSHAGADLKDYKDYLESRWHDEFEDWASDFVDPWLEKEKAELAAAGRAESFVGVASGGLPQNWDSARRLAELDAEGIAAEVVFPNTFPPFFPSGVLTAANPTSRDEYERRWAGLKAHNRWLVDFCAEAPRRRVGVAQVFLNDVEDAVEEIKWAKSAGLAAVLIPYAEPGGSLPPLVSEMYEPVWAACAEVDITVNNHVAAAVVGTPFGEARGSGLVAAMESLFFYCERPMWHLIFAGVFERYPNLRFAITESASHWVPQRLREMDFLADQARIEGGPFRSFCGPAVDEMSLQPSEYFARNCYLGASFMMRFENLMRHDIGVDRLMWGHDYPHNEGTYPYTLLALRETFSGVPEDELRMMLGGTAAKVYGFDLDALASVAAKIGPKLSDIQQPLAENERPLFGSDTQCIALSPPAHAFEAATERLAV